MSEHAAMEEQNPNPTSEQMLASYRALSKNILDVIWVLDLNTRRFLYVSPSVERIRGVSAEEAMSRDMEASFTPEAIQMIKEKMPARLQDFNQGKHLFYVDEVPLPHQDGSVVWTETTASIKVNEKNGHLELYCVSRDITGRKRTEEILQTRLKLLELAQGHLIGDFIQIALDKIADLTRSAIGFYHFVEADQKTLSLQGWSTRTLREFCQAEGNGLHYDIDRAGVWVDCVRQRKPVIHNDYASLPGRKGLPAGHAPILRELVVPIYRSDKVVAILGVGNKPSDYTDQDVETVSILADVVWETSERKRAEQNLSEIQTRLHLLSQNLEDVALYVYAHDAEGKPHFEYMSAGIEALTGVKAEDALRDARNIHSLILPEYFPTLMALEEKSRQDLTRFELEVRERHAITGEIRWMMLRSTPRRRPDGSTVWYGVQVDISKHKQDEQLLETVNDQLRARMQEIEELQDVLREQSLRDPLTGLYNRRYLAETLEREIARAKRENQPLSLIITDIDFFKAINDTYGHQIGDKFLIEMANLMRRSARSSDIVCRYGGEEFLLVLPGTPVAYATKRADEIRRKCAEFVLHQDGKDLTASMSFGVATFPTHGEEAEEIIIKADKAMYVSKAEGRNRVTVWQDVFAPRGTGPLFF